MIEMKCLIKYFILIVFVLVILGYPATSFADLNMALILSAAKGRTETVNILLHKGADVNAKDNDGVTALISATSNGHAETIKLLKKAGAKE